MAPVRLLQEVSSAAVNEGKHGLLHAVMFRWHAYCCPSYQGGKDIDDVVVKEVGAVLKDTTCVCNPHQLVPVI